MCVCERESARERKKKRTKETRNRQSEYKILIYCLTHNQKSVKFEWINRIMKWEKIVVGRNKWKIYGSVKEQKIVFNKRGIFSPNHKHLLRALYRSFTNWHTLNSDFYYFSWTLALRESSPPNQYEWFNAVLFSITWVSPHEIIESFLCHFLLFSWFSEWPSINLLNSLPQFPHLSNVNKFYDFTEYVH